MKKRILFFLFVFCACFSVNATEELNATKPARETETTTKMVQITSYPSGAKIEIVSIIDNNEVGGSIIGETPLKISITKIYKKSSFHGVFEGTTKWIIDGEQYDDGFVINAIPSQHNYYSQSKTYKYNTPVPKKIYFNLVIPRTKARFK